MKIAFLMALCILLTVPCLWAQGDYLQFQEILNSKCSQCHPRTRIEQAIKEGKNYDEIIARMLRLGAKLTEKDQEVLSVFWKGAQDASESTLPEARSSRQDPLGEYRAVVAARCTGCHGLERVEQAMSDGRSMDELLEMMAKRGAIITEADKKVLGTFWGKPLKPAPSE